MNLQFNVQGNVLIVTMIGELDHHSAEEVRNKIDDRLDREGITKLVLDFSGIKFMDSSGIGVVIGRYKKLSLKHGSVCVSNINESVGRIFEISGMFKIIKLYDTVEQAVSNI